MIKSQQHPGTWSLAVTAVAIGVAEFVVVGVLPAISVDLNVPLAQAGNLVGFYALSLAIGTPLVTLVLARLPCKPVLLGLITLFLIGNLLSAVSNNFTMLLAGRVVTAIAHGSFFAIGVTVAARLVPESQAGRAIALMIGGLTLAMVVGVPLGSLIGNAMGWRLPFIAVALLSVLGWLATLRWMPDLPVQQTGCINTQLKALVCFKILAMMSITALGFGASFSAFTFIIPILTEVTGFSVHSASVMLMVFGAATLAGNLIGGRWTARWGWVPTLRWMLCGLLVALIALVILMPYQIPMTLLLFIWGFMAFGMSPGFQAGMLETATRWTPYAIGFASALNISAFNIGITLGETLGSILVTRNSMMLTPWVGVGLVMVAQLPLTWLFSQSKKLYQMANERLTHGLSLEGKPPLPAKVRWQNQDQLNFILKEGKKRQIRRMCELVGLTVLGLKRVRIGRVRLGRATRRKIALSEGR